MVRVDADLNNAGTTTSITTVYQFVVIYDTSAGFVTGGGWMISPPGAYVGNPALTGKANFGFVSKYQKGANVPTGDTEFQFQAGGFNFKSTVYEWLVISGSKAQYKGSGTVNGSRRLRLSADRNGRQAQGRRDRQIPHQGMEQSDRRRRLRQQAGIG